MSFLGKLVRKVRRVGRTFAAVGSFVPGPIGAVSRGFSALDMTMKGITAISRGNPQPTTRLQVAQGAPMSQLTTMARSAGQMVGRRGRQIATYARGNAGKLAGGALTAGALLYDVNGKAVSQHRRRPRSKGITARELKSFTRVTALLNKFCKTPPPTKRRTASKGKSCR